MIKFFRHIRQNMIYENKAYRYILYAIGEIILVVIGILIALQINTWNEDQINSKKEYAHLLGIKHDLNAQVNDLKAGVTVNEKSLRIIDEMLESYIINDGFIKSDSTFSRINLLAKSPIPTPIETSFTELLQSGEIKLIKNDSLRNGIIRFYQNLKAVIVKTTQNFTYAHQPIVLPVLLRNTVFDKAELLNEFDVGLANNLSPISYSERTKSLAAKNLDSPQEELDLVNALNLKAVIETVQMQRSKILIDEANSLISKIENVINTHD